MNEHQAEPPVFSESLHGLRGVASLMVFFAHISFGFYDHFYHDDQTLALAARLFANFGTFGVELFFVISGFVITGSCLKYSPQDFAMRRFLRLYPVFLLFTLLYFVLNSVTHQEPARLGMVPLFANLIFIDLFVGTPALTPNAWSISFEVWYYVATYGLIHFLFRDKGQGVRRLIGLTLFFSLAGYMLAAFDITIYFAGGVLIYVAYNRLGLRFEGRGARGVALVALALIVGIATATDFPTKTYLEVPGIVIASLGLVIATLLFVQALLSDKTPFTRLLVSGPMRLVGTMSYTLYLAHPYVYLTMREIGKKIGLSAYPWQLTFPIYLMMTTAAALSVSWVVHRFVEVAPYKKFYGKRIYRDPLPERLLSSEAVIDPEAPLDVNRASL